MMEDTKILDAVLDMVDVNVNGDWCGNDPAQEFQEIANFIRDERTKKERNNGQAEGNETV
jgi:hypothetical protein